MKIAHGQLFKSLWNKKSTNTTDRTVDFQQRCRPIQPLQLVDKTTTCYISDKLKIILRHIAVVHTDTWEVLYHIIIEMCTGIITFIRKGDKTTQSSPFKIQSANEGHVRVAHHYIIL